MNQENGFRNEDPISDRSATPSPQWEHYWTKQRLDLLLWFRRNAPSLGELYVGSLRMVFEASFPGRTRYTAHAIREIRNRLPEIISGVKGEPSLQYKNRLDQILKIWKAEDLPIDGSIPTSISVNESVPLNSITIPHRVFHKISILIKDHAETRRKPEDAAFRLFEGLAPENQGLRDQLRPIILHWLDVTEWFVKQVHDSGKQDHDIDSNEFIQRFALFETTLGTLLRGFFTTVEGLDEILEDANS